MGENNATGIKMLGMVPIQANNGDAPVEPMIKQRDATSKIVNRTTYGYGTINGTDHNVGKTKNNIEASEPCAEMARNKYDHDAVDDEVVLGLPPSPPSSSITPLSNASPRKTVTPAVVESRTSTCGSVKSRLDSASSPAYSSSSALSPTFSSLLPEGPHTMAVSQLSSHLSENRPTMQEKSGRVDRPIDANMPEDSLPAPAAPYTAALTSNKAAAQVGPISKEDISRALVSQAAARSPSLSSASTTRSSLLDSPRSSTYPSPLSSPVFPVDPALVASTTEKTAVPDAHPQDTSQLLMARSERGPFRESSYHFPPKSSPKSSPSTLSSTLSSSSSPLEDSVKPGERRPTVRFDEPSARGTAAREAAAQYDAGTAPRASGNGSNRSSSRSAATRTPTTPATPSINQGGRELTSIDKKWGVLFDNTGKGTGRFNEVMKSLAQFIIEKTLPMESIVIVPEKLAAFYNFPRIEGDPVLYRSILKFPDRDMHRRIADLYLEFGCQFHLVQAEPSSKPRIPALTPEGFSRWMELHIRAFPDEEARRLEKVVLNFPLEATSSFDGKAERLPKQLSRYLLPETPDYRIRELLLQAVKRHLGDAVLSNIMAPQAERRSEAPAPSHRRYASFSGPVDTSTRSSGTAQRPHSRERSRSRPPLSPLYDRRDLNSRTRPDTRDDSDSSHRSTRSQNCGRCRSRSRSSSRRRTSSRPPQQVRQSSDNILSSSARSDRSNKYPAPPTSTTPSRRDSVYRNTVVATSAGPNTMSAYTANMPARRASSPIIRGHRSSYGDVQVVRQPAVMRTERDRSRDRDQDRDRDRDRSRGRERDRDGDRSRDYERYEKDSRREKDRNSDRHHYDRERDRDRDRDRDRERDRDRRSQSRGRDRAGDRTVARERDYYDDNRSSRRPERERDGRRYSAANPPASPTSSRRASRQLSVASLNRAAAAGAPDASELSRRDSIKRRSDERDRGSDSDQTWNEYLRSRR